MWWVGKRVGGWAGTSGPGEKAQYNADNRMKGNKPNCMNCKSIPIKAGCKKQAR